jgi:hypothetical protein
MTHEVPLPKSEALANPKAIYRIANYMGRASLRMMRFA